MFAGNGLYAAPSAKRQSFRVGATLAVVLATLDTQKKQNRRTSFPPPLSSRGAQRRGDLLVRRSIFAYRARRSPRPVGPRDDVVAQAGPSVWAWAIIRATVLGTLQSSSSPRAGAHPDTEEYHHSCTLVWDQTAQKSWGKDTCLFMKRVVFSSRVFVFLS